MNLFNIFSKLPDSTAPSGRLDYNGLLKIIRYALITGAAAALGAVITELPNIDLIKDSTIDNMLVTALLIPLLGSVLEGARRMMADYSK